MSKPDPVDCDDAQSDLENALTQIFGVAEVLKAVGVKDEVASYLGGQLEEHYEVALDAFSRIFKLDEYKTEAPETRAAEAMAAPPPDAGTRRALRQLVDKWDAEAGDNDDGGCAA
jgi:hypothetical protein